MTSRFELLAPAGGKEALCAAVRAGADAVYLGAESFSARSGAENFSDAALANALQYAHVRGVRVYLALNTLMRNRELPAALALVARATEWGLDGLIVQDLGLAALVRAAAPDLPLHASTQMSVSSPDGLVLLHQMGFSRAVLARELTKNELAACAERAAQLPIELEVFVHGALCVSLSGQCYFSAALGGQSANRGRCAGVCRLPFAAADGTGYDLSLKDLCLIDELPALMKMGVKSAKIEGRMKRPEYVGLVTALYRRAIDGLPVDEAQQRMLREVFSRSGFTDGYYHDRMDRAMFGVRSEEDKRESHRVYNEIHALYRDERPAVPVRLFAEIEEKTVRVTADDGQNAASVAAPAGERLLPVAVAETVLSKTGGTPYFPESVGAEGDLPIGRTELGALRRQALERLSVLRGQPVPLAFTQPDLRGLTQELPPDFPYTTVVNLPSLDRLHETADPGILWLLPLHEAAALRETPPEHTGVWLPRAFAQAQIAPDDELAGQLTAARAAGFIYALCGSLDMLFAARRAGFSPIAGFTMNLMNSSALAEVRTLGCVAAVAAAELHEAALAQLDAPIRIGLLVYGRLPLMLLRTCPLHCKACASGQHAICGALRDRRGVSFPVRCQRHYREILGDRPVWLADLRPETDFAYFHFTDESAGEIADVLADYQAGRPRAHFTRGLYTKGVK